MKRALIPGRQRRVPCGAAFNASGECSKSAVAALLGRRAAKCRRFALLAFLTVAASAFGQTRPYIGYAYPAGGQRGTTFQIKLGGQGLDNVTDALITGEGVNVRIVEYFRRINPQEMQLLSEQLRDLRKATSDVASATIPRKETEECINRIEKRQGEYVQTPACASLSALVFAEVSIAPDAEPGARELRLVTTRGISNPLVFHVSQLPEHTRKPMRTATIQVLGKEASALRRRPPEEEEVRITLPSTVNGQIASGEINRYRFTARRGQRLVFATHARQLIPFIADAVPGWFQPVLRVHDAAGKEAAYADDYRFRPDPVLLFDVPKDGEYVLSVQDALFRGREDFVYRVTAGELPFVTSVFPMGAKAGETVTPKLSGWNLGDATIAPPVSDVPGRHLLCASRKEICNSIPFALDTLPEEMELEPNNTSASAQSVTLPVILNGHVEKAGDSDLFRFSGESNQVVVASVEARQLDSPLDSVLRLTDEAGQVIAFSDDRESLAAGLNTHHADSWLMAKLPRDGSYVVHLSDAARQGGPEYSYRLRLSPPRPDFELRVVPSSISMRTGGSAGVTVYADRRDGLTNSIYLWLTNVPAGFTSAPVKIARGETAARLTITGPRRPTGQPITLTVMGRATMGTREIIHAAVPAEDRMQAFLWRQLAPAAEFKALVFDPRSELPPRRPLPRRSPPVPPPVVAVTATNAPSGTNSVTASKPRFTQAQIERRQRELSRLYEEGLLTDAFYHAKMDECEAMQ